MADERLRELERAASVGDPEAGAALLLELQRRGLLDQEQLRLLAYLGYPPALRSLPGAAGPADDEAWLRGSREWPRAVVVRGALAVAVEQVGGSLLLEPAADRPRVELRPDGGEPFPLEVGKRVVIGRRPDVDLRLDLPFVSREHCEVVLQEDGRVRVYDLGSANGTYLGGERIKNAEFRPALGLTLGGRGAFLTLHYRGLESPLLACLAYVQDWLDAPRDEAVEAVALATKVLAMRRDPRERAGLAAGHAVLDYPAELDSAGGSAAETRRVACATLVDWVLRHDSPLPFTPPPPPSLLRKSYPTFPLSRFAPTLEAQTGLRVVRMLHDCMFDVWSPNAGFERLRAVRHSGDIPGAVDRWRSLEHPGLPRGLGWGSVGEWSYFREARVDGLPATAWAAGETPVAVAHMIARLADALQTASPLLARCDLSERSILVQPSGQPVLLGLGGDWLPDPYQDPYGRQDPPYYQRGAWFHHVSPERLVVWGPCDQAQGPTLVYWLASVLYQLWVGVPPCQPTSPRARNRLHAILDVAPVPPSERGVDLDPRLEAVALRALSKEAELRQASPAEFVADLRSALGE